MYRSFFAILSVFLACHTASSAAASADCLGQTEIPANQTNDHGDITFTVHGENHPLPGNENVTFISGTFVNASSTLNITTRYTADVLDTFAKAFNVSFDRVEYTFGKPVNVSTDRKEEVLNERGLGEGDVSDVVAQRCYLGVVEKDCFDDIPTGTPVKACRPLRLNDDGSINPDSEDPVQPPATTTAIPAPTVTPNDSGAVNLLGQRDWRSSLLMAMIVTAVVRIGVDFVSF